MAAVRVTINPDLARERRAATFNVLEMTHVWDDGASNTERRQRIGSVFSEE